jgi:hypothetical protein
MSRFDIRYLQPSDVPALLALEEAKWEPDQAATADALRERIACYPELSIGAFCRDTGQALASLFMRDIPPELFTAPTRWTNAADVRNDYGGSVRGRSLFGISLSSSNPDAVQAIFAFFYPRALQAGWRDIYLGSPIPGFRKARSTNPALTVWQYVHARRHAASREPLDPQLRYYHRKGFRQIVSIQKDYFPHAESLDYGVILRGEIPLSRPTRLWRMVPLPVLERVASVGLKLSLL